MKRGMIGLVLSLFLILGISSPVQAKSFDREARECVAVVYTCMEFQGGELGFGSGTGFFVGSMDEDPMYLITNYHVISDYVDYGGGELVHGVTEDGVQVSGRSKIRVYYNSDDYEEAYIVDSDSTKDVAILKLSSPTDKRKPLRLCSPTDDMVGDTIYPVGYPGLAENEFAGSTTSWGASDATVTDGIISRIFTTEGTGRVNIQITATILPGNSGGPLLNEDGAAIGINTWSVTDNSANSINYAVSIDEAILMLKQSGVEYTMYSEDGKADGEDADEEEDSEEDAPEGRRTGGISVIGLGFIAVIAAAGVFFFKKKKKDAASGENMQPAQMMQSASGMQQMQNVPGLRIVAVDGYLAGRSYFFDGREMTFGRDASSTVCFPADAKGVSRSHCKLFMSNGMLMLMDSGSSYGTYMQATKLQAMVPVPVKYGDIFYIGSKNNAFKIQ